MLTDVLHDKAFELTDLEVGEVAGMPDGSDVELISTVDGTAFLRETPGGLLIYTPLAPDADKNAVAKSVVLSSYLLATKFEAER